MNSSIITQQQTQQLEKLETNYFTLRRKLDNLNRNFGKQFSIGYRFKIVYHNLSNGLDDELNNINNKLGRILNILNAFQYLEENF